MKKIHIERLIAKLEVIEDLIGNGTSETSAVSILVTDYLVENCISLHYKNIFSLENTMKNIGRRKYNSTQQRKMLDEPLSALNDFENYLSKNEIGTLIVLRSIRNDIQHRDKYDDECATVYALLYLSFLQDLMLKTYMPGGIHHNAKFCSEALKKYINNEFFFDLDVIKGYIDRSITNKIKKKKIALTLHKSLKNRILELRNSVTSMGLSKATLNEFLLRKCMEDNDKFLKLEDLILDHIYKMYKKELGDISSKPLLNDIDIFLKSFNQDIKLSTLDSLSKKLDVIAQTSSIFDYLRKFYPISIQIDRFEKYMNRIQRDIDQYESLQYDIS